MNHKHLDNLGIIDAPWNWCEGDYRQQQWAKEREVYGFDSRETWCLDYTLFLLLYERLKMYDEINMIDTSFHQIIVNGEKLTMQECINRMILGCEYYFKLTNSSCNLETENIGYQIGKEVIQILSECIFLLWW